LARGVDPSHRRNRLIYYTRVVVDGLAARVAPDGDSGQFNTTAGTAVTTQQNWHSAHAAPGLAD